MNKIELLDRIKEIGNENKESKSLGEEELIYAISQAPLRSSILECLTATEVIKYCDNYGIIGAISKKLYEDLDSHWDQFLVNLSNKYFDGNPLPANVTKVNSNWANNEEIVISHQLLWNKERFIRFSIRILERYVLRLTACDLEGDEGKYYGYYPAKSMNIVKHESIFNKGLANEFLMTAGYISFYAKAYKKLENGHASSLKGRCTRFTINIDKYIQNAITSDDVFEIDEEGTKYWNALTVKDKYILAGLMLITCDGDVSEHIKYCSNYVKNRKDNRDDKMHRTHIVLINIFKHNHAALMFIKHDDYSGRIHHVLTSIKSEVRKSLCFRTENGVEESAEVDVKACQPMLLLNIYEKETGNKTPFFDLIEDCNSDFYKVIVAVMKGYKEPDQVTPEERKSIKSPILNYLYSPSFHSHKKILKSIGNAINRIDPNLYNWIESFKRKSMKDNQYDKSYLPKLMQLVEVNIFSKIWNELIKRGIQFITIHDAVKVPVSKVEEVKVIMQDIFDEEGFRLFKDGIQIE